MARAKANMQRIVLPEGTEIRTLKAADIILKEKAAKLILIGDETEIKKLAVENNLTNIFEATIVDPETDANMPVYANLLFELRKSKGMTLEQASAYNMTFKAKYLCVTNGLDHAFFRIDFEQNKFERIAEIPVYHSAE